MLLSILIRVYRANPFRPHCAPGRHVWLCGFILSRVDAGDEDCPGRR